MAGVVHIPWYATGFRGDTLEQALEEISRLSLRYGATSYHVYRYRDDRYRFLQVLAFENKLDFERFWEGDDFIDFRVRHSGFYQVPVTYGWWDLTAGGAVVTPPPTGNGRGAGVTQGESA